MTKFLLPIGLALSMVAAQAHAQNTQQPTRHLDAAPRAVQNGVVVASIEAQLPLLRARESLMLARESAQIRDFAETHAALEGASQALSNYANHSSRHADEVRMLKSQIDRYDQSIGQNHKDAVQTIDHWWDQTASWKLDQDAK